MADIKDIFGESDSEEEEDQGGDVGKLFELSDDDDDDDLPVAPPPARSRLKQRGAPGGPPKPKAKAKKIHNDAPDPSVSLESRIFQRNEKTKEMEKAKVDPVKRATATNSFLSFYADVPERRAPGRRR